MSTLISILLGLHVTAGFIGLVAFWIPVFTRKGGQYHRLLGKVFKYCAYLVLAAAGIAVLSRLGGMLASGVFPVDQPALYGIFLFLGYLTLVTFVILRHGLQVLAHKSSLLDMNTPVNRVFAGLAIAASLFIIVYALYFSPPNRVILFALSPIGILSGIGILKAIRGLRTEKKVWMYEHLGAMFGAGIAFHTAFAVFGSSRLFELSLPGFWQVLPWILPTLIGVPATIIWTNIYKRRFGDT